MPAKRWRTPFEKSLWEELAELEETLNDARTRQSWREVDRAIRAVKLILDAVEALPEAK